MAVLHVKNLFVPFFPEEQTGKSSAVSYAISLAEKTKAHLTIRALGLLYEQPYSPFAGIVNTAVGPTNKQTLALIDKAIDAVREDLTTSDIARDAIAIQRKHQELIQLVGVEGRLHDLSIVDRPTDYLAPSRAGCEELLFHTGRPMIVTPPDCKTFSAKTIVVAWDGSARAARALNDAMPFLVQAERVEIASVINEKDFSKMAPGAEILPHLERHGVLANLVELDVKGGDAAISLLERARHVGAELLVMGAFGHTRWREWVLGGVTESMLRHASLPVFMSH